MEATAAAGAVAVAAVPPASNPSEGSPVMRARDTSRTPGRDTIQTQPAETVTNGVHTNGVENKDRTSPTAASVPALIQQPQQSSSLSSSPPPPAQPLSSQPPPLVPSQPVSSQPVSSQPPPPVQPSSSQPPSRQSPSVQFPLSVHPPSAQPQVIPPAPVYSPGPQPHQQYRGPPSTITLPSSIPSPLRAGHHHQQHREMNRAPKRFPSPDLDHDTHTPRFKRDISFLADAVQQSCPEAVRRIVRDKWEKCILGSEFHHAFVLNAIIHHANGTITRRAVRDFGQNMVSEAKHEIIAHLGSQDLDDTASAILEKCSDKFLDKALEQRLKTIDARSLINALARAERLGYESGDILEDQPERVVPAAQMHNHEVAQTNLSGSIQSRPPPAAPAVASLLFQTQPAQHAAVSDLKCRLCWREFQHTKPYEYHVQKQLCMKAKSDQLQYWCDECGAGFTTKVGQQYHQANAVCGLHATAEATPKPQGPPGSGVLPSVNYAQDTPPTPIQSNSKPTENLSPSQDDPYSHLTPHRRAALEEELQQAEANYGPRFKEAEQMADPMARRAKLESLHNTFSTKQSIIRKKYGVRLRVRRTRAEIEEERSRIVLKHGPSPGSMAETPSAKRQRGDDGSSSLGRPAYINHGPGVQTPIPPRTNHLSVSQMNNSGLGGSTATAAITDPTATASVFPTQPPPAEEQPPPNSLSSLQRKGYRVSSHVGQAAQPPSSSIQRSGSASAPVVLDDSSGSETDEDIPSTLPPKKTL